MAPFEVHDEDAPISALHAQVHANYEDNDPSDETQDFRFLTALTGGAKIPKRGEKDFEPHGTRHQGGILEASRQAMHDALAYTRVHAPRSDHVRAWYLGDGVFDAAEERAAAMSEGGRGRGLTDDHVVMVENAKGVAFRTVGKTSLGTSSPKLWLLPEEALYLVERGGMDLQWPSRPVAAMKGEVPPVVENGNDAEEEEETNLPLSLQAAYALLIGEHSHRGRVELDMFTVYANLRRSGYVVLRAPDTEHGLDDDSDAKKSEPTSLFAWLFADIFTERQAVHHPYGPLVKAGLYRSYNTLFRQLYVIPRHKPTPHPENHIPPTDEYKVVYHIWKPTRIPTFAKSNPGIPDFRIAVVSSRSTGVPSLTQLTSLLESTPWDPPNKEWTGPAKSYQRLKHGWRNVILAVVDQGIISYLRVGEAAFGEEKLHERFDNSGVGRGGKNGGYRGKGGRGRGRGRGR